jgi:hypothetical protein
VTCCHDATGAVVVVEASVVGDGVVVASVTGGEAVVLAASLGAVEAAAAGDVGEPDDESEQAAITPNRARAIAAARFTWRLRHRARNEWC